MYQTTVDSCLDAGADQGLERFGGELASISFGAGALDDGARQRVLE